MARKAFRPYGTRKNSPWTGVRGVMDHTTDLTCSAALRRICKMIHDVLIESCKHRVPNTTAIGLLHHVHTVMESFERQVAILKNKLQAMGMQDVESFLAVSASSIQQPNTSRESLPNTDHEPFSLGLSDIPDPVSRESTPFNHSYPRKDLPIPLSPVNSTPMSMHSPMPARPPTPARVPARVSAPVPARVPVVLVDNSESPISQLQTSNLDSHTAPPRSRWQEFDDPPSVTWGYTPTQASSNRRRHRRRRERQETLDTPNPRSVRQYRRGTSPPNRPNRETSWSFRQESFPAPDSRTLSPSPLVSDRHQNFDACQEICSSPLRSAREDSTASGPWHEMVQNYCSVIGDRRRHLHFENNPVNDYENDPVEDPFATWS